MRGTAFGADEFPYVPGRYVLDRGPGMAHLVCKRTEDTLDYYFNLDRWLAPGEKIAACVGFVDRLPEPPGIGLPPQLEDPSIDKRLYIDRLEYTCEGIAVWLRGGAAEQRYTVNVQFSTDRGAIKLLRFAVSTIGGSVDAPLVPGSSCDCEPDVDISAANVSYNGKTLAEVLDQLLYVPVSITSLLVNGQASPKIVERGQSLSNITLEWALNKTLPAEGSQSINQGVGSIPVGTLTAVDPGPVTADRTWTLTVSDGEKTDSKQASILFQDRMRWGAAASVPTDSAGILALPGNAFATSRARSLTGTNALNASGGKHVVLAYPAEWGAPSGLMIFGFSTTNFDVTTVNFTNASGHTKPYLVVATANLIDNPSVPVEIF